MGTMVGKSGGLILTQYLDFFTFIYILGVLRLSLSQETNPVSVALVTTGGVALLALFKIGVPLYVKLRLKRENLLVTFLLVAATFSGIVGAGFNIASIINTYTGLVIRL